MPTSEEIAALRQALADALAGRDEAVRRSEALAAELRVTRTERDLLQEQLNKFKRQLFAAKSEAARRAGEQVGGADQKDLFFNEAEGAAGNAESAAEEAAEEAAGQANADKPDDKTVDVPGHQRAKRGRKPLDPALPREIVRHELPEGERVCPHDGSPLREIGVETSEQLDIIPQQVRVIRHERVKYACPCCDGGLRLAARAPQVIPRGLFTESAMAWVIEAKYLSGLPLYRQAALLGRFGGTDISRNTLAATVVRVGQAVQPVVNLLRDLMLDSPIVYGDETEVQVLKEPGRSAQAKSYMWVQMTKASGMEGTGPPIRLFAYSPSRSTKTAKELYAGMRGGGVLMTDGYDPYDAVAEHYQLLHLGCWAHCRRYVNDALQALPKNKRGHEQLAVRLMELIGKLYHVEAQARRAGLDAPALQQQRQAHSVAVLEKIEALMLANLHAVLPNSLIGKALHYMAAQWPKLRRFVDDGRYSLDNNDCENAIRPFVVGRKAWLFSDTVAGATASANLYSLLQTCVINQIDGYRYLTALLTALPRAKTVDDYESLLPWRLTPKP